MVPPEQVVAFEQEMTAADVDWQSCLCIKRPTRSPIQVQTIQTLALCSQSALIVVLTKLPRTFLTSCFESAASEASLLAERLRPSGEGKGRAALCSRPYALAECRAPTGKRES